MALLKINLVELRKYELENLSTNPVVISLFRIDSNNFPNNSVIPYEYILQNHTIPVGQTYTIEFTEDAIYGINTLDSITSQYEFYVVYDYYNIRSCAEKLIIKILCDDSCCDDCKEEDRYTLNKMLALFQTYFMYLQKEYGGFNTIFASLTPSRLQDLFTIDTHMKSMNKNCLAATGCGEVTSNCGGCK